MVYKSAFRRVMVGAALIGLAVVVLILGRHTWWYRHKILSALQRRLLRSAQYIRSHPGFTLSSRVAVIPPFLSRQPA